MKNLILALLVVVLFGGCFFSEVVGDDVREFCYKGTTYLKFGYGRDTFGTVKMPLEKCNQKYAGELISSKK